MRGKDAAALALHRFGLGPAHGTIAAIANDPRGALLSDLDRPGAAYVSAKLPSSAVAARAVYDFHAEQQARSKLAQHAKKEAEAMGTAGASDASMSAPAKPSDRRCRSIFSRMKRPRVMRRLPGPTSVCRAPGVVLVQPFLHFC